MSTLSCLNQIAKYLKKPAGKLTIENTTTPVYTTDANVLKGFSNIVLNFAKANPKLLGQTKEDKAEIMQWIEYTLMYVTQCISLQSTQQILGELNNVFACRTYLVGHQLSLADIVLFYMIHQTVQNMTYLDKEKNLNLSRWFDNMQQDTNIRQKNKVVQFSTSYLSNIVPSRHI